MMMKLVIAVAFLAFPIVTYTDAQRARSDSRVLLLDLACNGIEIRPADEGPLFSASVDSEKKRTAWTAADSDDAFLAVDSNGDGTIEPARELVGLAFGPPDPFGYLSAMDGYGTKADYGKGERGRSPDGTLSRNDLIFSSLILWNDRNRDAVVQEKELQSLAYAGVASISLNSTKLAEERAGSIVLARSNYLRERDQRRCDVWSVLLGW